jgi:hypothetical protein
MNGQKIRKLFFEQIYKIWKSNVIPSRVLPTQEILCTQLSFVKQPIYNKRATVQTSNKYPVSCFTAFF